MKTRAGKCFVRVIVFMLILALVQMFSPLQAVQADTTIQDLINSAAPGSTVMIPAGTFNESLIIAKDLTLEGVSRESSLLKPASDTERVISVESGYNLTLRNLSISDGYADSGGGVFVAGGDLIVENCIIHHNTADYGGGIFVEGDAEIHTSEISFNSATWDGGGLYVKGSLLVTNSSLLMNVAGRHGGAVHVQNGNAVFEDSNIAENVATAGNGGGININNSLMVNRTTFDYNISGENGGAINQWNNAPNVSVLLDLATFQHNQAVLQGGAINIHQGASTTISNSSFTSNSADTKDDRNAAGGAIFFEDIVSNNLLTITNSAFTGNSLACSGCDTLFGGAVYAQVSAESQTIIQDNVFTENNGWNGGAVFAYNAQVERNRFIGNHSGYAGGTYLIGTSSLSNCYFENNHGANQGGALISGGQDSSIEVKDTIFSGNSTGTQSGAILELGSTIVDLQNVAVINSRPNNGAAIDLYGYPDGSVSINHLTINTVTSNSGVISHGIRIMDRLNVNIRNSILANISQGDAIQTSGLSSVNLDHVLFFNNLTNTSGDGISSNALLSADPRFSLDGYHILSDSPAINQGILTTLTKDIEGDLRDSLPDLGVDEFRLHVYLPVLLR